MKSRKVFGSIGAVLVLSLLIASFTVILPLQDGNGAASHNCLERKVNIVNGEIEVTITGYFVYHSEDNHPDNHFFSC